MRGAQRKPRIRAEAADAVGVIGMAYLLALVALPGGMDQGNAVGPDASRLFLDWPFTPDALVVGRERGLRQLRGWRQSLDDHNVHVATVALVGQGYRISVGLLGHCT